MQRGPAGQTGRAFLFLCTKFCGGICAPCPLAAARTAKTKRPGPFCEPSGPERVPGFVLSLCAGKGPARRAPCAAQQFFLRLGQFFECSFPPQGAALVRTALHVGKGCCTSGPGVAGPSAAFVGLQAGGRGVGPAGVQLAAGTPHHVHKSGLWPGRMLRCGHCSLTPDGRPQGRSPCPWP